MLAEEELETVPLRESVLVVIFEGPLGCIEVYKFKEVLARFEERFLVLRIQVILNERCIHDSRHVCV